MFAVLKAILKPIKRVAKPKACITMVFIFSGSRPPIKSPSELPKMTVAVLTNVPFIKVFKF
jgi:hypothetical protein